jgi:16S rRNA (guanine527-N7)-methyltransferase
MTADVGKPAARAFARRTARPENLTDGLSKELVKDRAAALALAPVSRETLARLDRFVALLLQWQRHTNLIARSTEPVLWTRHVADSLQLLPLASDARVWADLGTGGGFPGVVIACALAETAGACVHLIEASTKKATFLREAVRVTGAHAIVHAVRVEDFTAAGDLPRIDVVVARALAPLPRLLTLAYPLLKRGSLGLFAKGQDVAVELTEAAKCWKIKATLAPSRTDPRGRIVVVSGLEPLGKPVKGKRG